MKSDNGMSKLAALFRRRCAKQLTLVAMIAAVLIAGGGCDQNTESRVSQPPDQKVNTPTDGGNQATQGSKVTVYGNYFPRGSDFDDADGIPLGEDGSYPAVTQGYSDNGVALADGKGGYVFLSHIEIVTGGTTPTGASVTGSGSGSQTASATGSQTPTQTPESSLAAALGFAPGGVVDQAPTATGRGTSNTDKTSTNTLSIAQLAGLAKENPEVARLIIDRLFPPQTDTAPPSDQPAATPPPAVLPTGN